MWRSVSLSGSRWSTVNGLHWHRSLTSQHGRYDWPAEFFSPHFSVILRHGREQHIPVRPALTGIYYLSLSLSIFTEALKSVQHVATLFPVRPPAQQEVCWRGLVGVLEGVTTATSWRSAQRSMDVGPGIYKISQAHYMHQQIGWEEGTGPNQLKCDLETDLLVFHSGWNIIFLSHLDCEDYEQHAYAVWVELINQL